MGRLAVVGGADLLRQAGGRAAGCAVADGCRRWALAAGCCCEVWRCRCAGNGQAVQLMGCGVIGAALVPVPVCCWQAVQVGGVICCGGGALAWSSSGPRGHRAGPGCCRSGRPGRSAAGLEDGQKKKARAGGAVCAAALAFCLRWRCDLLRWVHRCGRWAGYPGISPALPGAAGAGADPGATVPAGNVPAWHGLRWRCSIRCVFAVRRRGQILHLTG